MLERVVPCQSRCSHGPSVKKKMIESGQNTVSITSVFKFFNYLTSDIPRSIEPVW